MIRLTDEQAIAAASDEPLVNIVSVPGSGKTTVAAERFGYRRYARRDTRGVLGLSFTRAAAGVLASRIRSRWGMASVSFPHEVMTFDQLHVQLLHVLLHNSLVHWPSGHSALHVVDEYRGYKGFRWLTTASYRRYAAISPNRTVVSAGTRVTVPRLGIGNIAHHQAVLGQGVSSHEDVRAVLDAALDQGDLWDVTAAWLAANYRDIVIDEVYDAADLDLQIAAMAMQSGIGVTLIGDPRQALYGWRGAAPGKVSTLLAEGFRPYPLSRSFRFIGEQMPALAETLRAGLPVTLPWVDSRDVDVALARNWRSLWTAGPNVLPLAFRSVANATDAATNLLLDVVTWSHFEKHSFGREGAIVQLGLEPDVVNERQGQVILPILADLVEGTPPAQVLSHLRSAVLDLGGSRRPRRLGEVAESARIEELRMLGIRMTETALIPGLTVHQAKGGEWTRVGVVLSAEQNELLSQGLQELVDEDCVLYVALTRAKLLCGRLGPTAPLFDAEESARDEG